MSTSVYLIKCYKNTVGEGCCRVPDAGAVCFQQREGNDGAAADDPFVAALSMVGVMDDGKVLAVSVLHVVQHGNEFGSKRCVVATY